MLPLMLAISADPNQSIMVEASRAEAEITVTLAVTHLNLKHCKQPLAFTLIDFFMYVCHRGFAMAAGRL